MSKMIPKSNLTPLKYADASRSVRHVFVRDLLLESSIGIYDHEKVNLQKIRVNIDLCVKEDQNPINDDYKNIVCYEKVVTGIKNIVLSGKIIEASTKEALEYATVVLKDVKTQKITGGISNQKGNFNIKVPTGTYDISVEFISFTTVHFKNRTLTKNTNLGTISLVDAGQMLDEVTIIPEKSTVDIRLDKKIYNVGKDMTVKGGTASDVLDNVPSVDVDAEGTVSLRGSENVRILIDGKPSALVGLSGTDALRQLPSDAIERVEVITSPSARYDAEGTAGILNIILRKGKVTGFNGSLSLNIGNPDQFQIAPNLNYRTKKLNLFTNFGYNYRKGPGNSLSELDYYSNGVLQSTRVEERDFERSSSGLNGNLGLEYYLTDNSSITGTFFIKDSDNKEQQADANLRLGDAYYLLKNDN